MGPKLHRAYERLRLRERINLIHQIFKLVCGDHFPLRNGGHFFEHIESGRKAGFLDGVSLRNDLGLYCRGFIAGNESFECPYPGLVDFEFPFEGSPSGVFFGFEFDPAAGAIRANEID